MNKRDLQKLVNRLLSGTASREEIAQYNKWFNSVQDNLSEHEFADTKSHEGHTQDAKSSFGDERGAKLLELIQRQIISQQQGQSHGQMSAKKKFHQVFKIRSVIRYGAAALVMVLMGIGLYLWLKPVHLANRLAFQQVKGDQMLMDAQPGHAGAILKLSNGETFLLDTAVSGQLTSGITKNKDKLSINKQGAANYATLETPMGRQQQMQLSDGTNVWLNAGSSIRFPTVFSGSQRLVQITGEVYFEVKHDSKHPFVVKAGNELIKDLGTHFVVNSYREVNGVQTTLLEGAVQIGNKVLQPGEQYINGVIKKVDPDAEIAWVNGYFHFDNADIQMVMQQLSRWYQVEVKYEGNIPGKRFSGEIQRSLQLSQVLELLADTGIHYTLDGHVLIIRP